MSKIKNAFTNGKAFIAFLTAGDPTPQCTLEYIREMIKAGADLIEIGIPFSDPTAEGAVIQDANIRALNAGMTVNGVFDLVDKVREESDIPLVFLTYLNPVFHYGYEKFFDKCKQCGVDGIIIPDLPFEEKHEVSDVCSKYDVDLISMISPTSDERIRMIAAEATGFVYVVSSMGVTGVRSSITTDLDSIVAAIKDVSDTPCAIGFGISTPQQAQDMAAIADGAIVGSAIVKIIAKKKDKAHKEIFDYVHAMKQAVEKA